MSVLAYAGARETVPRIASGCQSTQKLDHRAPVLARLPAGGNRTPRKRLCDQASLLFSVRTARSRAARSGAASRSRRSAWPGEVTASVLSAQVLASDEADRDRRIEGDKRFFREHVFESGPKPFGRQSIVDGKRHGRCSDGCGRHRRRCARPPCSHRSNSPVQKIADA